MDLREDLFRKIKFLNETIWEGRANVPMITEWLNNFKPDEKGEPYSEQLHVLYLLGQFMYFGAREVRELLRAVFRDLYKYPIIEEIRRRNHDTLDIKLINEQFISYLKSTRFIGIGNPSESGTHLLYYFRQENGLPNNLFIHSHQIFNRYGGKAPLTLRDSAVHRYVFLDDFCGSGIQADQYSEEIIRDIKSLDPSVEVDYYVLFATSRGLNNVKSRTLFDRAECVLELDDAFRCFDTNCHYFTEGYSSIDKMFAHATCVTYGKHLCPSHPLGYGDCQLLIGFHHNTPDNTLPIFWCDSPNGVPWTPIFKRYMKYIWGTL